MVRLIGLVTGMHYIADISVNVPYGVTVEVSDELALVSKDLWRAISQKLVSRVPGPPATPVKVRPVDQVLVVPAKPAPVLMGAPTPPSEAILRVEAENRDLRKLLVDQGSKLDAILEALKKSQLPYSPFVRTGGPDPISMADAAYLRSRPEPSSVVDDPPPIFIPSTITPQVGETKIEIQGEESESGGLRDAGKRLKDFKQRKSGQ